LNKALEIDLALLAIAPIISIMVVKHPKRPRDFSQAAKLVVDIASGQVEDQPSIAKKGQAGGLKGGPARAASLDHRRRQEIARKAAAARWGKRQS
jgi:hypothetical protein